MPLTDEMHSKLKAIVCKHLKIDESVDVLDIEQDLVEAWTSSKHLGLIMEIETKFKISFPIDEIMKLTSYESLADSIALKLNVLV